MKGYIYKYINIKTQMCYIGQTRNLLSKRDWEHRKGKGTHSYFDNAYRKYPKDFVLEILVEIDTTSKTHLVNALNNLEISYIALAKSNNEKLYNILPGGNNGWKNTPPTEKMLQALEEGRKLGILRQKENKFSEEEKRIRHNIQSKEYVKRNPEQYKKTYAEANNKRKEYKKKWYQEHKEELAKQYKLKYEANKEEMLQKRKEYYQKHREEIREKQNLKNKQLRELKKTTVCP